MPDSENISRLLSTFPLISDQVDQKELSIVLTELANQLRVAPVGSSVVEFGCYIGTTSLFIRRLLDQHQGEVAFHVYDSFAGLPEKSHKDMSPAGEQFKAGELSVSRKQFELRFKKAGLKLPAVHKKWFSDVCDDDVPKRIVFAFLDGDYYGSIRDSLVAITPKLINGAMIVVDDYVNEALPGAAQAVDEWVKRTNATVRIQHSLAIITYHKTSAQ